MEWINSSVLHSQRGPATSGGTQSAPDKSKLRRPQSASGPTAHSLQRTQSAPLNAKPLRRPQSATGVRRAAQVPSLFQFNWPQEVEDKSTRTQQRPRSAGQVRPQSAGEARAPDRSGAEQEHDTGSFSKHLYEHLLERAREEPTVAAVPVRFIGNSVETLLARTNPMGMEPQHTGRSHMDRHDRRLTT